MSEPWGLRRRLGISFVLIGGLVIGGLLLGLVGLSRLGAARHVALDRLAPARGASDTYLQLALDQESGVRGYLLTGRQDFLAPYRRAEIGLPEAATATRDALAGQPLLPSSFSGVQERLRAWQDQYAQPTIDAVGRGIPRAAPPAERGKQSFDALRAQTTSFSHQIDGQLAQASDRLGRIVRLLLVLSVLAVLLMAAVAAAAWRQLARSVLEPLDRLRRDARDVASGDLQHELQMSGPAEIHALGADVETMRRRVVQEYAAAQFAREDAERTRRLVEDQAEDLRRSNADLEQFAYVASHDLQEPLREVASFCQLLARRYSGKLDDRADTYIGYAVDGARRMQLLIDDLLAFSRVGRADLPPQQVALADCVQRARENLASRLSEADAVVVADGLPTVVGEPGLLTQLFANLITNAAKFRSEAAPNIRITAVRLADGWELSCSDNGIGIAPEHAERVFALFQRLHGPDEYEGTGIGLSLCRKIVEFHGGRLWVDTNVPHGTTMRWTMPDRPATPAQAAPQPAVESAAQPAS